MNSVQTDQRAGARPPGPRGRGLWRRIPLSVYGIAILAALFHLTTFWHAQSQTPDGWVFTGTLSRSPDYMQYRVWMRQSQDEGPVVSNRLTPEPNAAHLPVFSYYAMGQVSRLTGIEPEYVYEYTGAILAFVMVLLLFVTVRLFLVSRHATWVVFLVTLLGGGLTAHLKLALRVPFIAGSPLGRFIGPVNDQVTFEGLRFAYVHKTLMDTHFLIVWVLTMLAALAVYFAVRERSVKHHVSAGVLVAATTWIHVYEGVLLLAVVLAFTALLGVRRGFEARRDVPLLAICGGAAVFTIGAILYAQQMSGLPLPTWSGPDMFFTNVVLGHPVGWLVLGVGLGAYWRRADLEELFLLAWIVGCTVMLLSSPYYPFADRGATTLQIPLYIAAGLVFFERYRRVRWPAIIALVLVLGASAPRTVAFRWEATRFSPDNSVMFLDREHRATLATLETVATPDDILLADYFEYRWLMPYFPGRGYHPHFFLTVDFERRSREVEWFFSEAGPEERAAFLAGEGVDLVWVNIERDSLGTMSSTPGLTPIDGASHGTLYRFEEPRRWAPEPRSPDEGSAR